MTKPEAKSLGLTPQANGDGENDSESPSEDEDVDEEAQYAELGTKLTFEHDGQVLSLNNAADLAAWREERRKKWPTNSRVDQKEHKRKLIGQERRRLIDGAQALHSKQLRPQNTATRKPPPTGSQSQQPAELGSLTKGTEMVKSDNSRSNELATSSQERASGGGTPLEMTADAPENGNYAAPQPKTLPGISMADTDDEKDSDAEEQPSSSTTSSSSSESSSEDDSVPEEAGSKPKAPADTVSKQPLCRYFAASGYCRDGTACRFRHELSRKGEVAIARAQQHQHQPKTPYDRFAPKLDPSATLERKSIHDRLVEQERIEEDRLALKAIKFLGEAGFFKASASTDINAP